MAAEHQALLVTGLWDSVHLVQSRQWSPLKEGVYISMIYETPDSGSRAAFLRYLPGASVPSHRHMGFEHILILDGFQIDGEHIYRPGTLVIHPPGTQHDLVAPEGCLALGIWERPVEFK